MGSKLVEQRTVDGDHVWIRFEKLARLMADLDRMADTPMDLTAESLRQGLSVLDNLERLKLEKDLKTGEIPSWSPAANENPLPASSP
jgi:hypothetical protein